VAFNLASIKRGPTLRPPRIVLYGVHGIGKTTFGAEAPDAIIIPTEDGSDEHACAKFPLCRSSGDVIEAIGSLYNEEHEYKTAVLDSADWLENMLLSEMDRDYDSKELAYGKGAVILADKWRNLLDGFNALRNEKGMAVILIAHTEIKRFDSPETEPYDRYQPKLAKQSSALVQEWSDATLFTNYKTLVKKEEVGFDKKVARGITTGERLIYTSETPAYFAKNRYSLPHSMPLKWDAFADALAKSARTAGAAE
jgi:hypothetical protein